MDFKLISETNHSVKLYHPELGTFWIRKEKLNYDPSDWATIIINNKSINYSILISKIRNDLPELLL